MVAEKSLLLRRSYWGTGGAGRGWFLGQPGLNFESFLRVLVLLPGFFEVSTGFLGCVKL